MKLITRESTIRFSKGLRLRLWCLSVLTEFSETIWTCVRQDEIYMQDSVVTLSMFGQRCWKLKSWTTATFLLIYYFWLKLTQTITPLPSPISLNLYIKSIPGIIICQVLFLFFYKIGGGKNLALRIYTNNPHRVEHIFRGKFQKGTSTREMKMLVRTISYKDIFGRQNSGCVTHDAIESTWAAY